MASEFLKNMAARERGDGVSAENGQVSAFLRDQARRQREAPERLEKTPMAGIAAGVEAMNPAARERTAAKSGSKSPMKWVGDKAGDTSGIFLPKPEPIAPSGDFYADKIARAQSVRESLTPIRHTMGRGGGGIAVDTYQLNQSKKLDSEIAGARTAQYFTKAQKQRETMDAETRSLLQRYLSLESGNLKLSDAQGIPDPRADAAALHEIREDLRTRGYTPKAVGRMIDYEKRLQNEADTQRKARDFGAAATKNPGNAIAYTLASVPMSLAGGVGFLERAMDQLGNKLGGGSYFRPTDYSAPSMGPYHNVQAIRGGVAQALAEHTSAEFMGQNAAAFAYQTGTSMLDSGAVALLTAATGLPAAYLLGGSAATDGMMEAKARGATDAQAVSMGFLNGAAEEVFENLSVEHLLRQSRPESVRALVGNVLKQSFAEGSEEFNTTIANTIADAVVMADKSALQGSLAAYEQSGLSKSEAGKRAMLDWIKGLSLDFVGGAVSGGLMSGLHGAAQALGGDRGTAQDGGGQMADELASARAGGKLVMPTVADGNVIPGGVQVRADGQKNSASKTGAEREFHGEIMDTVRANLDRVQDMPSVAELSGMEFQKTDGDTRSLRTKVISFFNSIGNKVTRKDMGDIELNTAGARDSLAHGYGKLKAATFASLPKVLEQGEIIAHNGPYEGHSYDSYVISAPVTVGGETVYVGALVIKDRTQRYKLHEVLVTNKNGTSLFQSEATGQGADGPLRNDAPLGESVDSLSNISMPPNSQNVKEDMREAEPQNSARLFGAQVKPAEQKGKWEQTPAVQESRARAASSPSNSPLDASVTQQGPYSNIAHDGVGRKEYLAQKLREKEHFSIQDADIQKMIEQNGLDEMAETVRMMLEDGELGVDAADGFYRVNPARHIDQRDYEDVGNRRVRAFQFENPQLHPYFVDAAKQMLYDLRETLRGERFYRPGTSKDNLPMEGMWTGSKRRTSPEIEIAKDKMKLTYADIEKALKDIISDNGQENYAAAKRVELLLDGLLSNGHKSLADGHETGPNAQYIQMKQEIQGAAPNMLYEKGVPESFEEFKEYELNDLMLEEGLISEDELREEWKDFLKQQDRKSPEKRTNSLSGIHWAGSEEDGDTVNENTVQRGAETDGKEQGTAPRTGWIDGLGTAGHGAGVAERTEREKATDTAESAGGRQRLIDTVGAQRISTQDLGLFGGTKEQTVRVFPQSAYDEQMQQADKLAKENGLHLRFVSGIMLQRTPSGGTRQIFGYVKNGVITARADSALFSPMALTKHELFHEMAAKDVTLVPKLLTKLRKEYGPAHLEELVQIYGENLQERSGEDISEGELLEEILADAYGEMNRFRGADIKKYTDNDRRADESRISELSQEKLDSLQGGGDLGGEKLSAGPVEKSIPQPESDASEAAERERHERETALRQQSGREKMWARLLADAEQKTPEKRSLYRPEGMADEEYAFLNERWSAQDHIEKTAQRTQAELVRNLPREQFTGTPAMEKLDIRIDGSAIDRYGNTRQLIQRDEAAKSVIKARKKAEKRLNATAAEREFAKGVAAGLYAHRDIPDSMDTNNVLELADYYMAERAQGEDMIKARRQDISHNLDWKMELLFQNANAYKSSPAIILNHRTPQRNMQTMFGDELGSKISAFLFDPVTRNEADRIRFVNRQFDKVRSFTGKDGTTGKLTKQERALVHQVIEGRAASEIAAGMEMGENILAAAQNIENGTDAVDAAREMGLGTQERRLSVQLAGWLAAQKQMEMGAVDAVRVNNAAAVYSGQFDDYYAAINDFLVAHGYQPIGFIRGYAPHMQTEENLTMLNKALQHLGVNTDVTALPSSIAGLTADYKPGKKWNPYFLSRNSDKTDYDIATAFESYVHFMSDVFYHTDDIARVRAASRYFRTTYAPGEISEELSRLQELQYASTEEKVSLLKEVGEVNELSFLNDTDVEEKFEDYREKLFENIKHLTAYSDFVPYLDNYANILAGKQSMADRGAEYGIGRKILNIGNRVTRIFGKSQVAGNLSSALNQTAQFSQILSERGMRNVAGAVSDLAAGKLRRGGFSEESDFLTGKEGIRFLVNTPREMLVEKLFTPIELMDRAMATIAVRSKYLEQIKRGDGHAEALRKADQYGREVMGDRTKGAKPLAFESKNPISQMVHMFQLEALNTWEHTSKDLPRDFRDIEKQQGKTKAAWAVAKVVAYTLVTAFILNRLTDELYGGTPAPFDVMGLTANFIASGQGLSTNDWIRTVIDNGLEKMGLERLFDTQEDEDSTPFRLADAASEMVENVTNEIPFFRNISGALGWGDESLPIPDVFGGFSAMKDATKNSGFLSLENAEAAMGLVSQLLPGGRQMQKTFKGVKAMAQGGKINGYTERERLQYPMEDTVANWIKAALFGPSALSETESFYASEKSGLSANQTQLWKELEEAGEDRMRVYELIQDVRFFDNNKTMESTAKSRAIRDTINDARITDAHKKKVYEAMISDSKSEAFTELMDAGMSWDGITQAKNTFETFDADEEATNTKKASEFARWVDGQNWTKKQQTMVKETFKYWNMVPAEATRYEALTEGGLSEDAAIALSEKLQALPIFEGKKEVSDQQKFEAVTKSDLSETEKKNALKVMLGTDSKGYKKMTDILESGMDTDEYVKLRAVDGAAEKYLKLDDRGVSRGAARFLAVQLAQLQPESGKDQVSNAQKYHTVVGAQISELDKVKAMGAVMPEDSYAKLLAATDYGVQVQTYVKVCETADKDGNGSVKQEEATDIIRRIPGLTRKQRAALWQIQNKSWKARGNPFSVSVGTTIHDDFRKEIQLEDMQDMRWKLPD